LAPFPLENLLPGSQHAAAVAEIVEAPSWRKGIAELVGTFALIYVGVLVIVAGKPGLTGIALAHGLAIACLVSATMSISGGQLNPAVTIGLLSIRKISPAQAGINVVAQVFGGLLGGYLAAASVSGLVGAGALATGVPDLAPGISVGTGVLVEFLLTFLLMFVVMGTAVDPRFGARIGGLAIGLTVALDILAGGAITGAAMNPARWIGSAIPASHTANAAVYVVGPILGAVAAALLYQFFLMDEPRPHPEPAAQMRAKDNL
jgi:MIP family channel proteins